MATTGGGRWLGRGLGAVLGLGLAGGLAAAPEYIPSAPVGVIVGVAAALAGFSAGLVWDRYQQAKRDAEAFQQAFVTLEPADDEHASVIQWLAAEAEAVPFEKSRLRDVRQLATWCDDPNGTSIRLLAGAPGVGKTRLVLQLAASLRERYGSTWDVGWAAPDAGVAAVEYAVGRRRPFLIIIDDCEVRADIADILTKVYAAGNAASLRVLMIARSFDEWWTAVQEPLTFDVDPLVSAGPDLGPIASDATDQRLIAKRALRAFAAAWEIDVPAVEFDRLTQADPCLIVHATALVGLLRSMAGECDGAERTFLDVILAGERDLWVKRARRHRLDLPVETLEDVVVLSMLFGGTDKAAAHNLLRALPELRAAEPELLSRIVVWLHLYPRYAGQWLRPRVPAVFADGILSIAVARSDALTNIIHDRATPVRIRQLLLLVSRSAGYCDQALPAASKLIAHDAEHLVPVAIELCMNGWDLMGRAATEAISTVGVSKELTNRLLRQIPEHAERLAWVALALAQLAVRQADTTTDRADAHKRLAWRSSNVARYADALAAIEESLMLSRELAAGADDSDVVRLAGVLGDYAKHLLDAGRLDDAAAAGREAVELARTGNDPLMLSDTLHSLAEALHRTGMLREAIAADTESVEILLRSAGEHLKADEAVNIAGRLHNLSILFSKLGWWEAALDANERSSHLYTQLANELPETILFSLAQVTNSRAGFLIGLRRFDEAIGTAQEAVRLASSLGSALISNLYLLSLALGTLGAALSGDGQIGEALVAEEQAVQTLRVLASRSPAAFRPPLAMALSNLAIDLHAVRRPTQAVEAAAEAVALRQDLARADRAAFLGDLAHSQRVLAQSLAACGDLKAAVDLAEQSLAAFTELQGRGEVSYERDLTIGTDFLVQLRQASGMGR